MTKQQPTDLFRREALKDSDTFLRTLIRTLPDLVWFKDANGKYLYCNSRFERFFGAREKEIVGKTDYDFLDKDLAEFFRDRDNDAVAAGKPITNEEEVVFAEDGHREILETIKRPIYDKDGRLVGVLGIGRNITERKHAERGRTANLKFFESMDRVNRAIQGTQHIEQMMSDVLEVTLSIFECDRAWLLFPCDPDAPKWCVPMERTRPEYPGALRLGEWFPMDAGIADGMGIMLRADRPVVFHPAAKHNIANSVRTKFGTKSQIAMALFPKGEKPYVFGLHQCSYPRKWTEDESKLLQEIGRRLTDGLTSMLIARDLKKNEAFLKSIVDNIPQMIFVKDAKTLQFVQVNKTSKALFGPALGDPIGKTAYDFFSKSVADFITAKDREALATKSLVTIEEESVDIGNNCERILRTKKVPILDHAGTPKYLLGLAEDITERKRLEERLRQVQKMESIGRLAGGVAHDFNNMLGVILGHVEMAIEEISSDSPTAASKKQVREDLLEIREAAERSAELTRQLLAFARKQTVVPRLLNLNITISKMLNMLRSVVGEHIDLVWHPEQNVWPVRVDPSQIDRILANLCVNARDVLVDGGKITIETTNTTLDDAYCESHPGFVAGDFVMLSVSDNGPGMDQQTRNQIFEPFFTTKELGKGTGLGLATVYGIVKQNSGVINVYSEIGQGTTFKIYLPRQTGEIKRTTGNDFNVALPKGHETILLLEDELSVLNVAKDMLERLGYHVLIANTPQEAIRLAQRHKGTIDLLISDVVMPGMNGRQAAEKIDTIHPETKHLFVSGYTHNMMAQHGLLDETVNFISKPFSLQALAAKVRAVLDDNLVD